MGYVAIAYLVEFMVIGASLWGAWLFAASTATAIPRPSTSCCWRRWSTRGGTLPGAAGILARTQRSYFIRMLAIVGIVFAAGVTTKSVSQLGEMMFHPASWTPPRPRLP